MLVTTGLFIYKVGGRGENIVDHAKKRRLSKVMEHEQLINVQAKEAVMD